MYYLIIFIAIRQIRIASDTSQIGIMSYISSIPTTVGFHHSVVINWPTKVWYIKVRYFAYDRFYDFLTDVQSTYK